MSIRRSLALRLSIDKKLVLLFRVSTDKNTAKNPFSDVPRKTDASAHTPLQDMSEDGMLIS